jgi:ubiquinone/menaquinone biosynthesis C-methylase UbiE
VVMEKPPAQMKEQGALAGDHIKSFIGAMHNAALKTAPEVVAAVNSDSAHHLIDVGGGSGSYTIAFLNARPNMKATLFDLPEVIEMARERLQSAGLISRVTLKAGDFYKDELPGGNDLVLLSAIIHQNGPAQNEALFRKIYRCLDACGRIIVRDHVMSEDRTQPPEGAMFAVNMLVGTPDGGTYTFDEIKEGLSVAGFTRIRLIRTKGMFSLVEGFKP